MLVKAVMTPNPVTITENTTLLDAMDEMRRKGFSRLLVTRDERLIGIVTELDLIVSRTFSCNHSFQMGTEFPVGSHDGARCNDENP